MQMRSLLLGLCLGATTAALAAPAASNWLNEAVLLRLPQSEIVRHPIDPGKYYLCWSDGVSRYGVAFRRRELEAQLRLIPQAGRMSVPELIARRAGSAPVLTPWTDRDNRVCWPD